MEKMSTPADDEIALSEMSKNAGEKPYVVYIGNGSVKKENEINLSEDTNDDGITNSVKTPDVTDIPLDCYACDQCEEKFFDIDILKSHYKEHNGMECNFCDKPFASRKTRWEHFIKTHLGIKNHFCDVCGKVFAWKFGLKEHYLTHTGERPFTCDICQMSFRTKKTLTCHHRTHTGEKPYECTFCHKSFSQISYLKFHIRSHHLGIKPYSCHLCNTNFTTLGKLRRHASNKICTDEKKIPVYINCNICKEEIKESHLREHSMTHAASTTNMCNLCNKHFVKKERLVVHMLTHTRTRKYVCEVCNKAFTLPAILRKHANTHLEKSPFNCDICNKGFTRKDSMKQHYTIHTGQAHKCRMCKKKFLLSQSLEDHYISYHSGLKVYLSEEKNFEREDDYQKDLELHLPTHAKKTIGGSLGISSKQIGPQMLHVCKMCGRYFADEKELKVHQGAHAEGLSYFCDICNKGFKWESHLNSHSLAHRKTNPKVDMNDAHRKLYTCDICKKTFIYAKSLKVHYESHTDKKLQPEILLHSQFQLQGLTKEDITQKCLPDPV